MSFQTRKSHLFHFSGYVLKDEIKVTGLEFTWKKLKKKLSLKFGRMNGTGICLNINFSFVCVVLVSFYYIPILCGFCSSNLASVSFLQITTDTF